MDERLSFPSPSSKKKWTGGGDELWGFAGGG